MHKPLSLQSYETEVDADNRPKAVLKPTPIGHHVKVDIGCEAACESNTLDFESMEIDQEPNSDCSHDAYHESPTGSSFRPEHFQSERNDSYRRYKTQRGESPFTAGATATLGFKPQSHHPEKLARVTSLKYRLLGYNPIESFAINCERTLTNWILLLRETTPPHNVSSSDPRWVGAFKVIDSIITGRQGEFLLRRLAYVQLTRIFATLEAIIKSDRDNGRIHREPYYTNAHIAMDIYMSAQEKNSNTGELRRKLRQSRRRFSRRWSDLAILAPLFVLIYSDAAEVIMYIALALVRLFLGLTISKQRLQENGRGSPEVGSDSNPGDMS
jgi:hypothetical protein